MDVLYSGLEYSPFPDGTNSCSDLPCQSDHLYYTINERATTIDECKTDLISLYFDGVCDKDMVVSDSTFSYFCACSLFGNDLSAVPASNGRSSSIYTADVPTITTTSTASASSYGTFMIRRTFFNENMFPGRETSRTKNPAHEENVRIS